MGAEGALGAKGILGGEPKELEIEDDAGLASALSLLFWLKNGLVLSFESATLGGKEDFIWIGLEGAMPVSGVSKYCGLLIFCRSFFIVWIEIFCVWEFFPSPKESLESTEESESEDELFLSSLNIFLFFLIKNRSNLKSLLFYQIINFHARRFF